MSLSKVLVAYDGSESSQRAIQTALSFVDLDDTIQLDIVYIIAIPDLEGEQANNFASILEMMKEDANKLLQDAVDQVDEADIANPVNALLYQGVDPAAEIAKLYDTGKYDLLIVGSRGLSGIKEYMGSVSHKLLGVCQKPVLIVK